MTTENATKVVATTTKQNEVTKQLLMDYLKQTNSNLLPNEMAQFVAISTAFNLNPYKREVYAIAYGQGNNRKLSIIVGYEVYLRRAEEFPQYDGYETKFFGEGANMGCSCIVYRKDRSHPVGSTVFLREYTQNNTMWNNKPHVMLEKVAIATAMRRAFPSEFNGMPYTSDELPDEMTGGDKLREQGYTEIDPAIDDEASAPEGIVHDDPYGGPSREEYEEERQKKEKPAAPVPLSEARKTGFYTMISSQTKRVGTPKVNEITEKYGGVDKIVLDKELARKVAEELINTPGIKEQEVLF